MSSSKSLDDLILTYNAVRRAFLRSSLSTQRNDYSVLAALYEAKTGLSVHGLSNDLMKGNVGLTHNARPDFWIRGSLDRLRERGLVQKASGVNWSITTAGRVMIHRLNQEALKILKERGE